MNWIGLRKHPQTPLYTSWKRWGRKFRQKKKQQVSYAITAALMYHIRRGRNFVLWHDVILRP